MTYFVPLKVDLLISSHFDLSKRFHHCIIKTTYTTHAPTHARPSLPIVPKPNPAPAETGVSGLHETAAGAWTQPGFQNTCTLNIEWKCQNILLDFVSKKMCRKSELTSLPRKNWDNIVGYDVTIRVQEIGRVVNNLEQEQSLLSSFIQYLPHFEKYFFQGENIPKQATLVLLTSM